ncbi:protein lifeguard 1 isoform X2 [Drosophila grimshawi]|uniref:GH21302 n=1 Tax=Drosophila grimshawi TaxID=7222 RepID=B4J865_DROGR|nr:protein lifeguard 1 isoform X2 [Drosophila grimshawi]EDW01202.1 GH21302 [Drosophila grimshawi]
MYKRMPSDEPIEDDAKRVYQGERYPPIPLPPPPIRTGTNAPILLESTHVIIQVTPDIVMQNDSLEAKNIIFNDQSIRKGFIRKVYLILLAQLVVTFGVICIFMYHEPTNNFVQENPEVMSVAMVINIVVLFSMACCETARRTFPINFVCLGFFTVTMSLLLGAAAGTLDSVVVLEAVAITAALVVGLSIFAIQTKYDFTSCRAVLVSVVICLLVLSISASFVRESFADIALSCLGALLASFLLIYDTQLIIGGNHKYQFNPEDYIFAALTLYMDIVRIFVYVLRLLARR